MNKETLTHMVESGAPVLAFIVLAAALFFIFDRADKKNIKEFLNHFDIDG